MLVVVVPFLIMFAGLMVVAPQLYTNHLMHWLGIVAEDTVEDVCLKCSVKHCANFIYKESDE